MKKRILVVLMVLGLFSSFRHPFYLGVVELKYNQNDKALQGYIKLFTNDLEDALKKLNSGQSIDLIHPRNKKETEKLLQEYIGKRLMITVDGQPRIFDYQGYEHEEEAIWIYIEITKCPEPKKVIVENTLLYDFLKEQANIIHLELRGEKKSLKVTNPDKQAVFEF